MKHEKEEEFRCDKCRANLTNKKHIRIFMGFTSGWMVAPYIGGKPVAGLCNRQCEFHFCRAQCFALFFSKRINEIRPDTRRHEERNSVRSALEVLLAEASVEGSRMPGTDYVGTRDHSCGTESERGVGDSADMRLRTLSGSVSGSRDIGQENQSVDRIQSHNGLGSSRVEVPKNVMAAAVQIPKVLIRSYENAKAFAWSMMP